MADLKHRCSSEGIWLAAVNKKTTPTLERNSYVERRTVTQSNREGESWAKDWVAPLVDYVNVGGALPELTHQQFMICVPLFWFW